MARLITLNGLGDEALLSSLLSEEIIVYEDIQGSKIWINWDGEKFSIRSKSLSNEPINLIDLAMQNYYNPVINYFNNLIWLSHIKLLLEKFNIFYKINNIELFKRAFIHRSYVFDNLSNYKLMPGKK